MRSAEQRRSSGPRGTGEDREEVDAHVMLFRSDLDQSVRRVDHEHAVVLLDHEHEGDERQSRGRGGRASGSRRPWCRPTGTPCGRVPRLPTTSWSQSSCRRWSRPAPADRPSAARPCRASAVVRSATPSNVTSHRCLCRRTHRRPAGGRRRRGRSPCHPLGAVGVQGDRDLADDAVGPADPADLETAHPVRARSRGDHSRTSTFALTPSALPARARPGGAPG